MDHRYENHKCEGTGKIIAVYDKIEKRYLSWLECLLLEQQFKEHQEAYLKILYPI